ncbi:ABD1 [Sanghuangporus vaninii]
MPFDPVRDAVLNSPLQHSNQLPSPLSSSPQSSYFTQNNILATSTSGNANASIQSPSSARRATDLSVLLNSDDQPPTSPFQRRPSSSGSAVVASPSCGLAVGAATTPLSDTPRPRSTHLSHILQSNSDDGSPRFVSPAAASYADHAQVPPATTTASNSSPSTSPLLRNRETLGRSRASTSTAPAPALAPAPPNSAVAPLGQGLPLPRQPDILRRMSSSSASGSKSHSRSPEMPRTPLSNVSTLPGPDPPRFTPPPVQRRPSRPAIPYAPRKRLTAPGSILVPLTEEEREFYKNLSKNPLKELKESKLGKRKFDEVSHGILLHRGRGEPPAKLARDVGLVVQHYNLRPDVGVTQRQQSPIIGLKNFNNWVKSVLIARFAHPALHPDEPIENKKGPDGKVQFNGPPGGRVLDLGCGKGGDLNKWQKARVREYVGVDIAEISVEQARQRYQSSAVANPTKSSSRFTSFFAALDCFSHSLTEIPNIPIPPQTPPFDVVSMQFCMHYAFESVQKARVMLENVTRWLRKGGRFVGTIPNDRLLLERLDALPPDSDLSFGNSVYRIKFDDSERRPVFGHRYTFFLRDAVEDVPEYIVYWDNFVQMASEYHLQLLYKAEFHDVYAEHCEHPEYGPLLQRMKVVDANGESQMDEDQWEAANVYVAFAFEKA